MEMEARGKDDRTDDKRMRRDGKKEKEDLEREAAGETDVKVAGKLKMQGGNSQYREAMAKLIGPYTKHRLSGEIKSCEETSKIKRGLEGLEEKETGHTEVGGSLEGTNLGDFEKLGGKWH